MLKLVRLLRRGTVICATVAGLMGATAACRNGASGTAPSASSEHTPAPPPGFRHVVAAGWSLAIPASFVPALSGPTRSNQTFLIYQGNDAAPGAPRILFSRHTKPAEFPSRVFGLTALDGLQRKGDKRVVSSRQHQALGVDVTDIEVLVGESPNARFQWRRLFVLDNVAYTLTYSVAEAEAPRHRSTAQTVLASLRPVPN